MNSKKLHRVPLLAAAVLTALSVQLAPLAASAATPQAAAAALHRSLQGRVQLHGNALRGLPYVPLASKGAPTSHAPIAMRPFKVIKLEGDGDINVRSNVYPIDVDGDGKMELLLFNGQRLIQVFRQDGTRLWQVTNPRGRVHRTNVHRDTVAVFDADGDGRQEVAHCWTNAQGRDELVLRDGLTGKVKRAVALEGSRPACQIAGIRFAGEATPRLFVAHSARKSDNCWRTYTENFSRTVVFDAQLRKVGEQTTCEAGHYAWPLDENQDGYAEAVFVGKYLLDRNAKIRCVLPGWNRDHVDSLATADIDPKLPGHEVVAVGYSGTRFYRANDCRLMWTIPTSTLQNPQWLVLARLDAASAYPSILVHGKGRLGDGTALIDAGGKIRRSFSDDVIKSYVVQNADLDGARGADEVVGSFGRVWDSAGRLRLDTGWYWNLGAKPKGAASVYDRWAYAPLLVDLDRDGKDEMIVWGRDRLIIGKRR